MIISQPLMAYNISYQDNFEGAEIEIGGFRGTDFIKQNMVWLSCDDFHDYSVPANDVLLMHLG